MSEQQSMSEIVTKLIVAPPTHMPGSDGLYVSRLTHPSLQGELRLVHMTEKDRDAILKEICITPKEIDPLGELFRHIKEAVDK